MSVSKLDLRAVVLAAALLLPACNGRTMRTIPETAAQPAQPAAAFVQTAASPPPRLARFEPAQAGLEVPAPRGWRVKRRDAALLYEGPMRLPTVVMFEPERRTYQGAVDGLAQELAPIMSRVRVSPSRRATTVAGYPATVVYGTGGAEGYNMRWQATVIDAERPTVMVALAPSFVWGMGAGRLRGFERGIRRADGR